jgi:hypothetical protein
MAEHASSPQFLKQKIERSAHIVKLDVADEKSIRGTVMNVNGIDPRQLGTWSSMPEG